MLGGKQTSNFIPCAVVVLRRSNLFEARIQIHQAKGIELDELRNQQDQPGLIGLLPQHLSFPGEVVNQSESPTSFPALLQIMFQYDYSDIN